MVPILYRILGLDICAVVMELQIRLEAEKEYRKVNPARLIIPTVVQNQNHEQRAATLCI